MATTTLEEALDAYAEHLALEGKASARGVVSLANKTLARASFADKARFRLPGGIRLDRLTGADIMALRAARRQEGNSAQTVAHELKTIRAAAFHAQAWGYAVPMIRWKIPTPTQKTRWLTLSEWRQVYNALDPQRPIPRRQSAKPGALPTPDMQPFPERVAQRQQAQDLFVALTLTGGRWSEVRSLTTDQVGAGGIFIWGRKTQRERIVPLPAMVAEVLERRKQLAEASGSPYLFAGREDAGPQKWCHALRRAIDRAGLNAPHLVERHGRATIHSLRHTFASWLIQAGINVMELQELLGHTTLAMTRRYSHLGRGEAAQRAAVKLQELLSTGA